MRGYRGLVLTCLSLGFLLGWGQNNLAEGRDLQPGDQIKLSAPGPAHVTLQIKEMGEYQIETLGESDTYCTLTAHTQGQIAADDNSGVARNCRMQERLSPGQYRLYVRKGKRPVQVKVTAFQMPGQVYPLRLGYPIQDELSADQVRAFRVTVRRRRWLDLQAWGVTVRHCRLVDAKGWHVEMQRTDYNNGNTPQGRWRACSVRGLVEPGTYQFQVVGQRSLPVPRGSSVTQGRLLVLAGDRALRPFRWNRVTLKHVAQRSFWFTIPQDWGHPKTGQVKLLLQATSTSLRIPYWSIQLSQNDWLNTTSQSKFHCSRSARSNQGRRCDAVLSVRAGQRYKVTLHGKVNQQLWLRYVVVFPQDDLPLNRRIRVLDQPGQWTDIGFSVTKAGQYWVETWPHTKSCALQREIRPNIWRTVTAQSLALPQRMKSSTSAPAWEDVRALRWSSRLESGGTQQWLQIKTESTVVLETFGRIDTKCTIKTASGRQVAYNDDQHKKNRNCRVEQRLQPGLYQLQVQPYGNKRGTVTMQVTYKGDKRNTAIPLTGGCSFPSHLDPGNYRLLMSSSGRLGVREVGVLSMPLQHRSLLRISQLQRGPQDTGYTKVQLPVQLPKGYRWFAISGTRQCELKKDGKLVKKGWVKRSICQIRTKLAGGLYTLSFQQHLLRTQRVSARIGSSAKLQRQSYRRLPQLGSRDIKALKIKLPSQNGRWLTHFTLSQRQQARIFWQVPKSGLYRLQTNGLLKVHCSIQNARDRLYQSQQPTLQHRNCDWTGYLKAGSYQVSVQAIGKSEGRVNMTLHDLTPAKAQQLPMDQNVYAALSPGKGAVYQWKIQKKGVYYLNAHSIDGKLACRLEQAEGWPILSEDNCAKKLSLDEGSYQLYLYPNNHRTRYRLSLYTERARRVAWPGSRKLHQRNIKSKPLVLPLQQAISLRYAAPQPSDTFTLRIPTRMTVQASLSRGLMGRLFRKDAFVAQWTGGQATQKNEATLEAGSYRLVLQGKGASLSSGRTYSLSIQVTQSQPGFRLWQSVPSTIQLTVKQPGYVEVTTEGNGDVWCQVLSKNGRLLQSNDDASSERWDCKLKSWLKAGTYRVVLDGPKGRTWLRVQHQEGKAPASEDQMDSKKLRQLILSAGSSHSIHTRVQQTLSLPLQVKKAGLFRIHRESQGSTSWSVRVANTPGIWKQVTPEHSYFLTYLDKGQHQVVVQPFSDAKKSLTFRGKLWVDRWFPTPKRSVTVSSGQREGEISAGKSVLWKFKELTSLQAYQMTVTLHGVGSAVLLQAGRPTQQCIAGKENIRTCRWYAASSKGLQLWFASPSTMRYRVILREAIPHKTSVALEPGQQWRVPPLPRAAGQFVFKLRGKGNATFEVMGGKAACILTGTDTIQRGCRGDIALSEKEYTLVVRYSRAPQRILLYPPSQRAATLWGDARPGAVSSLQSMATHRWIALSATKAQIVWYQIHVKKQQLASFRVHGSGAIRCAMGGEKPTQVWAHAGASGCHLEQPLSPGQYWLGIQSEFGNLLQGQAYLSLASALTLREGRQGPYLLGTGETRWFVFTLPGKRRVGLGAIGRHDDIQCSLKNSQGRIITTGCQRYLTLPQGTYWYQVSLPHTATATTVYAVLRGKNPPPKQAPTSYLRKLIKE